MLSIGALAAATGIPVETIRTWERRYGFPEAQRKPSGHRVYPVAMVPRLRRIAQALARGHRAAEAVAATEQALDRLLAAVPERAPAPALAIPSAFTGPSDMAGLLSLVSVFAAEPLRQRFQLEWSRLGPLVFLEQVAAPFLVALGAAWQDGSVEVRHEHFASAVLGDFLRTVRQPLEDRASGPVAALATPPGELHGLGLQMAAIVFAMAGWRPLVVGVDTPLDQIAALARDVPVAAVALSLVQPRVQSEEQVRSLRRRLPRHVPLLVGGSGARRVSVRSGLEVLADLGRLDGWLRARGAAART
jgi:hypothetical protein